MSADKYRIPFRLWVRIIWHTRPGHGGWLIDNGFGLYCSCGRDLSR